MLKFKEGARIVGPHGPGVIKKVREGAERSSAVEYALSPSGQQVLNSMPKEAVKQIIPAIVDGFYGPDRYPYVVLFDCGYEDFYGDESLQAEEDALWPAEKKCTSKHCLKLKQFGVRCEHHVGEIKAGVYDSLCCHPEGSSSMCGYAVCPLPFEEADQFKSKVQEVKHAVGI